MTNDCMQISVTQLFGFWRLPNTKVEVNINLTDDAPN